MKRLLLTAAAVMAFLPMTAQAAATANGTVDLSATVADTCAIRAINGGTISGATATNSTAAGTALTASGSDSVAGAALSFTTAQLFNPTTAATNALTNTFVLNGFCNYSGHNVSLQSRDNGLVRSVVGSTPQGTFVQRVNYSAILTGWGTGGGTSDLKTDGVSTANTAGTAKTGAVVLAPGAAVNDSDAVLTIATVADSSFPALAGTYSDRLTIRLGATFP